MSQLRMQAHYTWGNHSSTSQLDMILSDEIREHLVQQQGALSEMIKVVKNDLQDLTVIENGIRETSMPLL
jgi:hypothetical protein